MNALRVKICGITRPEQGQAIAQLGASALGFICVRRSPRYVTPEQIRQIVDGLPLRPDGTRVDRVGVFVDASLEEIAAVVAIAQLNGVQLHGHESPEFCRQLRHMLPTVQQIKACRVHSVERVSALNAYCGEVDAFLLDAYHPHAYGGTGLTLDWAALRAHCPEYPWFLAGGLTPENVLDALGQVHPTGLDLSSGVERSPGDKDLHKVAILFERLKLIPSSLPAAPQGTTPEMAQ